MSGLVLASLLSAWLHSNGHPKADELKKSLLDKLVSHVVMSKTKVRPNIIKSMSCFLKRISHEDFKGILLPGNLR